MMDLDKFKHPRFAQHTEYRILCAVIYTETKVLERLYPASFIEAVRKSTFKITLVHHMDVRVREQEISIIIKKHNPDSFSSDELGSIRIHFNENGIIQSIYDERGVATDLNVEDNINEEAYNAIKLNTAVTNIFTTIYYLIEARKYFNNELFKGETNEQ